MWTRRRLRSVAFDCVRALHARPLEGAYKGLRSLGGRLYAGFTGGLQERVSKGFLNGSGDNLQRVAGVTGAVAGEQRRSRNNDSNLSAIESGRFTIPVQWQRRRHIFKHWLPAEAEPADVLCIGRHGRSLRQDASTSLYLLLQRLVGKECIGEVLHVAPSGRTTQPGARVAWRRRGAYQTAHLSASESFRNRSDSKGNIRPFTL